MNKEARAQLLRSRFTVKYGKRNMVPEAKKDRPPPEPPRRPVTSDCFGAPVYRYGATYEWIFRPDPRRKVEVKAKLSGDEPTALTKIAQDMYRWNRMEWKPATTNYRLPARRDDRTSKCGLDEASRQSYDQNSWASDLNSSRNSRNIGGKLLKPQRRATK